tara:strand:- start:757 stop:2307 length:1551 start_codon:yes stop_codon:yes gene_type:complete
MLKLNNIFKISKAFCLLISIVITSCSVNDKEAFDIINEAKKFLSNITLDEAPVNKPEEKISTVKNTNRSENTIKKVEKKNSEILISKKEENKKDSKKITAEKTDEKKNINNEEEKVSQSKLLKKIEKKDDLKSNQKMIREIEVYKKTSSPYIKIGVLLPLTGENKEIGNLIINALELALFQAGNENIHLIIKDTEANPKKTQKIFSNLIEDNVNLFIGPLYSRSLASIESFASQENIKLFALTNNTNLAKEGVWIFGINPQQQTKTILDFLISKDKKKIGFLLPDNSYGYLLYDTVQKILERKNITPTRVEFFKETIQSQEKAAKNISKGFQKYEESLKEEEENNYLDNDVGELISTVAIDKPLDSIFIGASGQTLTILASQLQYSSVDPKKVSYVGTSSWEDESILQEPALNGGYFSATSENLQQEVSKIYSIAYGTEMPKVAMVAYDILSLLSATLKEKGDINMKYLLSENGYLGLRGLFRLKLDGTVERTFQIKTIKKAKFKTFKNAPEFFRY